MRGNNFYGGTVGNSQNQWAARAKASTESGNNPPFLIKWVEVSVPTEITDSVHGNFDFAELQAAGLNGWQIHAVIPKTKVVGLKNETTAKFFKTWGGGIGGNVVGAFVLLSKRVESLDDVDGKFAVELSEALLSSGIEV